MANSKAFRPTTARFNTEECEMLLSAVIKEMLRLERSEDAVRAADRKTSMVENTLDRADGLTR